MGIANNTPYTTEGFANDNSDFDGLTGYNNFRWIITLAKAEIAIWRRATTPQKGEPTNPTHVPV